MSTDLRTTFAHRADLIAYVRTIFPAAAAIDDQVAETPGGRAAAEFLLARIDPPRYAATRNSLDGAVTRLSPYLRHGVVGLAEVRDQVLARATPAQAQKLLYELSCRDFFQKVYRVLGDGIWQEVEPWKTGWRSQDYAVTMPADVVQAMTGLACIDEFVRELYTTGYLHNHARMWLASYLIHWRRVHWQAGARWFLTHLLDGDPASNNLSWQWVASTFSQKPYYFNRENLERYTNGHYCATCPLRRGCPLEGSYEALEGKLFPHKGFTGHAPHPSSLVQRLARVDTADFDRPEHHIDPTTNPAVIWLHGDNLNPSSPALRAAPGQLALWVWDDALLTEWQISLKRLVFLYESLVELPVTVRRGKVTEEVARFAIEQGARLIITNDSPSPRFERIVQQLSQRLPVAIVPAEPFAPYDGLLDLRRGMRYWRQIEGAVVRT
jgi:deoxyribodipyrimidine photo-lyase